MNIDYQAIELADSRGQALFVYRWQGAENTGKVIQLVHGMAEHALRYDWLAGCLVAAGYTVYAQDLPGHGRTGQQQKIGYFAQDKGFEVVLDQVKVVNDFIHKHPSSDVTLLGHSMGSVIVQHYLIRYSATVNRAVLSGAPFASPWLFTLAGVVAAIERRLRGPEHRSRFINNLVFGGYNKFFSPTRTASDWLSRDQAQVDLYEADKLCGFLPTTQMWSDVFAAFAEIVSAQKIEKIPQHLPIYIFGGGQDPVGDMGKGLPKLYQLYKSTQHEALSFRLYAEGRHEMFNELNREQVCTDLIQWLEGESIDAQTHNPLTVDS